MKYTLAKSYLTEWCCNAQYETCIATTNRFNLCSTKFDSPYANTTINDALEIKRNFFATVSTLMLETTTAPPTNTKSQVTVTPPASSLSKTAEPTLRNLSKPPSGSSQLSSGEIAGIAISGVVLILVIAAGFFFLGRKYINNKQQLESHEVEESRNSDKIFCESTKRIELEGQSKPYHDRKRVEMPGIVLTELGVERATLELP